MKKSSLLALAIAGTLAAPAVMAEVYMSARLGVDVLTNDDADGVNKDGDALERTTFGNLSSRMGWQGETDLGNGLTGFGKMEVAVDGFGFRDLYVGLSGDWGKVTIAESAYGAFYNHVTGGTDQPYWIGGNSYLNTGRTSNMISYAGGGDLITFEVGIEADGTDTTNAPSGGQSGLSGYQAAATVALGDNWAIAVGMFNNEDSSAKAGGIYNIAADNGIAPQQTGSNGDIIGAAVNGTIGDFYLAGTFQQDDDVDSIVLHAGWGGLFVNYGQADVSDADWTPAQIGLGYAHSIGENTTFWVEGQQIDGDNLVSDATEIVAALRYDIQ